MCCRLTGRRQARHDQRRSLAGRYWQALDFATCGSAVGTLKEEVCSLDSRRALGGSRGDRGSDLSDERKRLYLRVADKAERQKKLLPNIELGSRVARIALLMT